MTTKILLYVIFPVMTTADNIPFKNGIENAISEFKLEMTSLFENVTRTQPDDAELKNLTSLTPLLGRNALRKFGNDIDNQMISLIIPQQFELIINTILGKNNRNGNLARIPGVIKENVIYVEEEFVVLLCNNNTIEYSNFTSFNSTAVAKNVFFYECKTSNVSFASTLRRLNVNLYLTKKIIIGQYLTEIDLNMQQFEGLPNEDLLIHYYDLKPYEPTKDLLKYFSGMRELVLLYRYINLPPFPGPSRLETVRLYYGKSLGAFGDCTKLRTLRLISWDVNSIPERWLSNCSRLETLLLEISHPLTRKLLKNILEGVTSLRQFNLRYNELTEIQGDIFKDNQNLAVVKILHVRSTTISLRDIRLKKLKIFVFSSEENLTVQGIPVTEEPKLILDFNTHIKRINIEIDETDYEKMPLNVTIILRNVLTVDCDCRNAWFARALRDGRLHMAKERLHFVTKSQVYCDDGKDLPSVPLHLLECNKFQCGECTCRRQWRDNSTVARCSGTATHVPRARGLCAIHAASNRIETFSAHDLPDTLLFVDISYNRVSSMDKNAIAALFNLGKRRVRLAGNPLVCNCVNQPLIEALQIYKSQVEDYEQVTCNQGEEKRAVRDVILSELCAEELKLQRKQQLWIGLGVCAVLLGLLSVAGVVYWRYKQHIKVYLYARGYCMWCLREDDVDSDRPYDAFLSFSHQDESFVLQELLPKLDTEYKLCLHFRDWVLGDFIPAQITRSVEQSRRTIIVLSRNFVASVWGMVEFRTAHSSALEEGRARLIVIALDDVVDDEDLAPELRGYIRTNTYIRWGDNWFWQKLLYTMPHRPYCRDQRS